ncbi:MAG: SH3 domain-containing protein [Pirellula sp.]
MMSKLFSKYQTGHLIRLLICAGLFLGLVANTSQAWGQWKLEKTPPKPTKPTKPISKPANKPGKKQAEESTPEQARIAETTAAKTTAAETQPTAAANATKPASMRVIEKDNQRFVHVPRATVRCGPGTDYYPTSVLSKGTVVEVYVETDDGWSGIRPPSGSHNWVQADALYLMPGARVAEVSQENVPAWVGSDAVKSDKLLFQTELSKTQTVAILGEAYRGQGVDQKLWFKISPPQGEFRWVKSSMIGTTPVEKEPETQQIAKSPTNVKTKDQQVVPANFQEPEDSKLAWSDEAEQTQKVQEQIRREQSQAQASILSKNPNTTKPRKPQADSSSPQFQSGHRGMNRPENRSASRTPDRVESPAGNPNTPQAVDPWQLIHQRQVGPRETNSMNHVLGIFGLSLVDPNTIQGHPQQGRTPSHRPPNAASANAASMPAGRSFLGFGNATQTDLAATSAGLENLPRPSGRYSPRRYSDFDASPTESFADRPSPLMPEVESGVSTASFAPYAYGTPIDAYSQSASDGRGQQDLESFQTPQLQDALTQLSVIVSRPAEQWNLAPLRDSAKMWIERGETPLVSGEARLLLDRIERFESVRQRSSMTPLPAPTNYSDAVPLRTPSSDSEMSGWLVAVHTSLPGQPEFALTDDLGNVKAYVRPTTGLNLRRYVQQPVTVFGPQGFLPNLNAKQVVADRVVRLR